MACFKSSIFKKLIKGHEHKPFKANWLKKEPPLSTVTVYQSLWSCHCKREGKKEEKKLVKMSEFKSSSFKKFIKRPWIKVFQCQFIEKRNPTGSSFNPKSPQSGKLVVFGNCNGGCDGDCDGDWNTFIFHRFDSFCGSGVRTSWAWPEFRSRKLWRILW